MAATNLTHRNALTPLSFVHERLPLADPRAGFSFVHESEFNSDQPSVRVLIDADSTEIHAFDGYECAWSARFSPTTPANVIKMAALAAFFWSHTPKVVALKRMATTGDAEFVPE